MIAKTGGTSTKLKPFKFIQAVKQISLPCISSRSHPEVLNLKTFNLAKIPGQIYEIHITIVNIEHLIGAGTRVAEEVAKRERP